MDAKDPRSRTPTKGAEVQKGSTVAETGGKGQGFGLSSGGGGTGGYLDVANFCCPDVPGDDDGPDHAQLELEAGQPPATTLMRFVIQKDGRIVDVAGRTVERTSGLDYLAQRALAAGAKLPPLPAAYPEAALTVHLFFEYVR